MAATSVVVAAAFLDARFFVEVVAVVATSTAGATVTAGAGSLVFANAGSERAAGAHPPVTVSRVRGGVRVDDAFADEVRGGKLRGFSIEIYAGRERHRVVVRGKGNKERLVPIADVALRQVQNYLAAIRPRLRERAALDPGDVQADGDARADRRQP